jgi:Tol biopolymer transport system component
METAPIRATIELPAPLTLAGVDRAIALSPDGTQLALVAHDSTNNTSRIFVRPLSRLDLRALAGTEDASYPFWSPDGKSLGFFAGGKLKRIELAEGIVRAICDAPQGRGGSWSSRGFIVFAPGAFGALFQVPDGGGTPVAVTKLRTESETDRLPRCLPDGRRFLYYSSTSMKRQDDGVYVFDPETNASRLILKSQTEAVYVDPGFLAFVQDENLMLQPFDVKRLELTGTARPIASGVQYDINRGYLNLGLTPGGRLVYQEVLPAQRARLVWIDRAGVETAVSADPLPLEGVSLAPDGKKAAVTVPGDHGETRLAILDLERGIRMPFGEPNANSNGLIWSPDGRSLAFATQLEGGYQIGVQAFGEGSKARMLTSAGNAECLPGSFTLDGRELLFEQRRGPDKIGFLMMADVDGHTPPHDILGGSAGRFGPQLSPDARWTGFEEAVEGGLQLSIVPFPAGGAPTRVTTTGVRPTQWGWLSERELWWTSSDNHVWSATVTTKGADAEIGSPRPLIGGHALLDGMQVFSYSRARDRFLAAKLVDSASSAKLVLVTDWKTGLSAEGPRP